VNSVSIYNPLNLNKITKLSRKKISFPFFDKGKGLKIINIARFVDQKDHITLLKAMRELDFLNINFKLLIIGKGINLNKMNYFILENNLNKKIKILNFKTNPYPYLKAADLFVLTSKFEGLPNVLLEALSLKKFVISTNCPTGPSEILSKGKGGILIKMGDYKELAEQILFYQKNKKQCTLMLKHGIKQLHRFDEKENLLKYYSIIKKYIF
jgi:glycosyltransferase involved in cell wall biosynthesis